MPLFKPEIYLSVAGSSFLQQSITAVCVGGGYPFDKYNEFSYWISNDFYISDEINEVASGSASGSNPADCRATLGPWVPRLGTYTINMSWFGSAMVYNLMRGFDWEWSGSGGASLAITVEPAYINTYISTSTTWQTSIGTYQSTSQSTTTSWPTTWTTYWNTSQATTTSWTTSWNTGQSTTTTWNTSQSTTTSWNTSQSTTTSWNTSQSTTTSWNTSQSTTTSWNTSQSTTTTWVTSLNTSQSTTTVWPVSQSTSTTWSTSGITSLATQTSYTTSQSTTTTWSTSLSTTTSWDTSLSTTISTSTQWITTSPVSTSWATSVSTTTSWLSSWTTSLSTTTSWLTSLATTTSWVTSWATSQSTTTTWALSRSTTTTWNTSNSTITTWVSSWPTTVTTTTSWITDLTFSSWVTSIAKTTTWDTSWVTSQSTTTSWVTSQSTTTTWTTNWTTSQSTTTVWGTLITTSTSWVSQWTTSLSTTTTWTTSLSTTTVWSTSASTTTQWISFWSTSKDTTTIWITSRSTTTVAPAFTGQEPPIGSMRSFQPDGARVLGLNLINIDSRLGGAVLLDSGTPDPWLCYFDLTLNPLNPTITVESSMILERGDQPQLRSSVNNPEGAALTYVWGVSDLSGVGVRNTSTSRISHGSKSTLVSWNTSKTTVTSWNTQRFTSTAWQTSRTSQKTTSTVIFSTSWQTLRSTTTSWNTSQSTTTVWNTSISKGTTWTTSRPTTLTTTTQWNTNIGTSTTWLTSVLFTTTWQTSASTGVEVASAYRKNTSVSTTTSWTTSQSTTTVWGTSIPTQWITTTSWSSTRSSFTYRQTSITKILTKTTSWPTSWSTGTSYQVPFSTSIGFTTATLKTVSTIKSWLTWVVRCPSPEVPILLSDGSEKLAGDIKLGDVVVAWDEEAKCFVHEPVVSIVLDFNDLCLISLDNGREGKFAKNHRFLLEDGSWEELQNLSVGTTLHGGVKVTDIVQYWFGPVVQITINRVHTYVTLGVVSHNVKIQGSTTVTDLLTSGPKNTTWSSSFTTYRTSYGLRNSSISWNTSFTTSKSTTTTWVSSWGTFVQGGVPTTAYRTTSTNWTSYFSTSQTTTTHWSVSGSTTTTWQTSIGTTTHWLTYYPVSRSTTTQRSTSTSKNVTRGTSISTTTSWTTFFTTSQSTTTTWATSRSTTTTWATSASTITTWATSQATHRMTNTSWVTSWATLASKTTGWTTQRSTVISWLTSVATVTTWTSTSYDLVSTSLTTLSNKFGNYTDIILDPLLPDTFGVTLKVLRGEEPPASVVRELSLKPHVIPVLTSPTSIQLDWHQLAIISVQIQHELSFPVSIDLVVPQGLSLGIVGEIPTIGQNRLTLESTDIVEGVLSFALQAWHTTLSGGSYTLDILVMDALSTIDPATCAQVSIPVLTSAFPPNLLGYNNLSVYTYNGPVKLGNNGLGYSVLYETDLPINPMKVKRVFENDSPVWFFVGLNTILKVTSWEPLAHTYILSYSPILDADISQDGSCAYLTETGLSILDASDTSVVASTPDNHLDTLPASFTYWDIPSRVVKFMDTLQSHPFRVESQGNLWLVQTPSELVLVSGDSRIIVNVQDFGCPPHSTLVKTTCNKVSGLSKGYIMVLLATDSIYSGFVYNLSTRAYTKVWAGSSIPDPETTVTLLTKYSI